MTKPGVLYISYDGMLEPLGQSQVLAYLEQLSPGYRIHLISFEKRDDWADPARRQAVKDRISAAGIRWTPLRYHKSPTAPATAFDILVGTIVAGYLTLRHRYSIIHARSYIAALIGLLVKRVSGRKLLFDMRGLWADERVDGGLWPANSRLYRLAKTIERRLLLAADHIVTLTKASAAEIASFSYMRGADKPITIIPTCADLQRFQRWTGSDGGPFTFGFVGAAGTWSMFDQILASFRLLVDREPESMLLIVNRGEHAFIRQCLAKSGIESDRVELVSAEHRDVPALISRMNIAAALRKPTYSQIACAPTKLAEYLGCGVPCLVNRGIGDVVEIVEQDRVGVVLSGFSAEEMSSALDKLVALSREPDIKQRCVASARARFSLEQGVSAYRAIYDGLVHAKADVTT